MKISVVTPCLNQHSFLTRTARSILSQQGSFELEWIVVDGGSTDATFAFLKDTAAVDPRLRFSSQPDRGQADALNRGFAQASGDVVAWLNSDDLYVPGALAQVAETFAGNSDIQWLIGRCQIIDADDRVIRAAVTRYKNRLLDRFSHRNLLRENCISQPAVFWRRTFGAEVGELDTSLHYAMDYDLWLRMAGKSDPLILRDTLASFRFHAQSKSGRVNREQFDEGFRVAQRYFNGDTSSQWAHRLHLEKIVWSYRVMRLLGR
jgi:glycosyltransferase involved in cell wall biosynthesis